MEKLKQFSLGDYDILDNEKGQKIFESNCFTENLDYITPIEKSDPFYTWLDEFTHYIYSSNTDYYYTFSSSVVHAYKYSLPGDDTTYVKFLVDSRLRAELKSAIFVGFNEYNKNQINNIRLYSNNYGFLYELHDYNQDKLEFYKSLMKSILSHDVFDKNAFDQTYKIINGICGAIGL